MSDFFAFLTTALGTPTDKLFIVFGLVFLAIAITGGVVRWIRPGKIGRRMAGIVGPLLIFLGLGMQISAAQPPSPPVDRPAVVADRALPTATPMPMPSLAPTPTSTAVPTPVVATSYPNTYATMESLSAKRAQMYSIMGDIQSQYDQNARQIIDSMR